MFNDYDYIYEKEYKIEELTDKEKNEELMRSVIQTKTELNNANINYDYAERELVDYYTYQIKALQYKLDYLTNKVKRRGLILDLEHRARIVNE